jgi:hypothetical protein
VVVVLLLLGLEHRSGSFIFLVYFFFFLAVCIRTAIKILRCNWYHLDINILFVENRYI